VVADEVRKLAEQSGRAGVDIENLTKLLDENALSVSRSVARGVNTLHLSQENMAQTRTALKTAITRVEAACQGVDEISLSVREQASYAICQGRCHGPSSSGLWSLSACQARD
jgi:methyl-accepting chemotaxis protein